MRPLSPLTVRKTDIGDSRRPAPGTGVTDRFDRCDRFREPGRRSPLTIPYGRHLADLRAYDLEQSAVSESSAERRFGTGVDYRHEHSERLSPNTL